MNWVTSSKASSPELPHPAGQTEQWPFPSLSSLDWELHICQKSEVIHAPKKSSVTGWQHNHRNVNYANSLPIARPGLTSEPWRRVNWIE